MSDRRHLLSLLLIAWLLAACAAPVREAPSVAAADAGTETGTLAGAPYRIDMPERWNGELVLFVHGYEPAGTPRSDPWPLDGSAKALLDKGYAVAASGYSTQGWAVAEAVPENERLRRHFLARHGRPARSWLVGHSMGGQVALASVERYPRAYDGVLSLCGVNAPAHELFTDGVLTPLVAFDVLFPRVLPQAPAGLADPSLPPQLDPAAVEAALAGDEAKAKLLAQRVDIPRGELAGALWLQYLALRELDKRAGGFPVDNRNTRYHGFGDDAAFNATVRRYAGDPEAVAYLARNAPLSGRVRTTVVLQSNAVDPTVPARFGRRYLERMREAGTARHATVLPPVGVGHCNFEPAQVDAAFDALRAAAGAR